MHKYALIYCAWPWVGVHIQSSFLTTECTTVIDREQRRHVTVPAYIHAEALSFAIAMICVTKSRTGNYDFSACARARGFPGSTMFRRTHTHRRVYRAITR